MAAGLGEGACAIVQSMTFLATANAIRFTGAEVIFCDSDPLTGLMTEETLRQAISRVPDHLELKAILPVHLAGLPVDLKAIRTVADEYGAKIIADSCHATGGTYHDTTIGACKYEDFATFSFYPVKTMTMGEGGAITCRDKGAYEFMKSKRSHGMIPKPEKGPWYYEMPDIGYNYRATDMQCALGLSQLKKLNGFIKRRAEIVEIYNNRFDGIDDALKTPADPSYSNKTSWHLYAPQFNFDVIGKSRRDVMEELKSQGILTQVHYFPVHLQPYYVDRYGELHLPGAKKYYDGTLSLPLYPDLTDEQVNFVADKVIEIITV
jgi:dTDP-4-amino-4,6-dideoxygalactose transaminase